MSGEQRRVEVERRDAIAYITLARPERKNAIDLAMATELQAVARSLEHDASVRVIVLAAHGEVFSVGGDIDEFVAHKERLGTHIFEMTDAMHDALLSFRRAKAPLVVSVQGIAAGGGLSLVTAADLVVASTAARFVSAYTRAGLSPDVGLSWFLPRRVGRTRAFDLMATNRTLSAVEAESFGLVSRVVEPAALAATVREIAEELAALPSAAASAVKSLLEHSDKSSLADHLDREAESIATLMANPETVQKLEAFVRRQPTVD